MFLFSIILPFSIFMNMYEAGVTEISPDSSESETIETISDESWMPSNIFDVKANAKNVLEENEITESPWEADASPIFKALRDFIFQASDGILENNEDPTEEIVKIIEKGLIEATTLFLSPSEEIIPTVATSQSEISIVKIENHSMLDRIGLNLADLPSNRSTLSITACSDCYDILQTCVQMCFARHNCNDVQRQARVCPPPSSRLCNIFTQWGPVDECTSHEDCRSPLLCCSDGCINKCSPGVWRN